MRIRGIVLVAAVALPLALAAQSEEFGAWTSLFDGKDATGWVVAKGADRGKAPARWSVEDGALTNGSGGVDDIATVESFDNFELEIEYKLPRGGNSGVYLRGQVEVQILDSHGKAPEALGQGDVGGIYGVAKPLANPQKPAGEWNAFRIRHIGNRVTVWHNGVLVQDNVWVERPTAGALAEDPSTGRKLDLARGPLMLQGDHTRVWYRNIRIRPLCSGQGWRPIWNGEDLSAFRVATGKIEDAWRIVDHSIANLGKRQDMWTKESFGNFLVHYEYRSDPKTDGGNSGFYLRDQWEIQILSRSSTTDKHGDGALYSIHAPSQVARHGPENWNHMDVKVEGVKIWVWQNGTLIHDGRICERRTDSNVPTPSFSKKPFKFQGDHGDVWFTNIYVRPLPDSPAE